MDHVRYCGVLGESRIQPKSHELDGLNYKTGSFNFPKVITLNENDYIIGYTIRTCYVQCNTKVKQAASGWLLPATLCTFSVHFLCAFFQRIFLCIFPVYFFCALFLCIFVYSFSVHIFCEIFSVIFLVHFFVYILRISMLCNFFVHFFLCMFFEHWFFVIVQCICLCICSFFDITLLVVTNVLILQSSSKSVFKSINAL